MMFIFYDNISQTHYVAMAIDCTMLSVWWTDAGYLHFASDSIIWQHCAADNIEDISSLIGLTFYHHHYKAVCFPWSVLHFTSSSMSLI